MTVIQTIRCLLLTAEGIVARADRGEDEKGLKGEEEKGEETEG